MNLTKTIIELANAYNETMWHNYASCFKEVTVDRDGLDVVPRDILNVLIALLGVDQTSVWINKKISDLDNNSVIELVNNDIGRKAVKMFVLSMPN